MPSLRTDHDAAIAKLAIPALGTLVAEPLYVLADTAIIGHVGTNELAGLALASTVLLTIHAVLIFLAYGTTGPVARLISSGREAEAADRSLQGLWLAAALGIVGSALIFALRRPLLDLFGADPDVITHAERYLTISLLGFPAMLLMLAAGGAFHGRQDTSTPLALAVGGAVVNLVLESILIFGFGYGVGASALSTVIAQLLSAGVGVTMLMRWIRRHTVHRRPQLRPMLTLLKAGQALVLRTAALRGSFTLSVALAARMGAAEVAAHQVALQIWGTLALALDAVAIAGQALTGKWLGTGNLAEARAAARRMIEIDIAVGVLAGALVIAFRSPVSAIFSDDPAVTSLVAGVLVIVGLQQPLNGHVFALDGILIGAGDLGYLARSMVIAAAIFLGFALVISGAGLGLLSLWAALCAFMAARAVALQLRWRSEHWLHTTI
ncbi:MAG: MATE family efflux transporter [Acidimicrobiales bacterium]